MIITDRFVCLSFGRTGSTFVRQSIRQAENRRFGRGIRWIRNVLGQETYRHVKHPDIKFGPGRTDILDQHGVYDQTPSEARERPVVMAVRNPFDHHVSKYKYRFWHGHPWTDSQEFRVAFPGFPDLSFADYLRYRDWVADRFRLRDVGGKRPGTGPLTTEFLQMVCRDHRQVLAEIDLDYLARGSLLEHLPSRLHLLRTERLNHDLRACLRSLGYGADQVDFIREKEPVQPEDKPSRSNPHDWRAYYDKDLCEWMWKREAIGLIIYRLLGVGDFLSWPRFIRRRVAQEIERAGAAPAYADWDPRPWTASSRPSGSPRGQADRLPS